MKLQFLLCIALTGMAHTGFCQANTRLSNLVSPVAVNQHLLPSSTNTRDLGSSSYAFRNIYLRGDIYVDGTRFMSNAPGTTALNVFVGSNSGISIRGGINNTAVGHNALSKDTSGSNNTALGAQALVNNTSGFANIAIGSETMRENKEGFYNIAIGNQSLLYNNGSGNIAVGLAAMPYATTARYNVAIGNNSLFDTRTSEFNTAIGSLSGNSYNNGYNNVFVGANTDVNGHGYYNVIAIGQGTICTNSSQVVIGNSATTSYRAYAGWSNISDGRYKKNLKEDVPGLSFITKLRAVTYTLDASGLDGFLNKASKKDEFSYEAKASMAKAMREKEALVQTGFIAQEVEKAAKEVGFSFSGVEAPANENDVYTLKYSDFVVPLVKAVQELHEKDKEIDVLKQELAELKQMVLELKRGQINSGSGLSAATLESSTPNPSNGASVIRYFIPQNTKTAHLLLTNMKGQIVKQITLSNRGSSQFTLNTSSLAAGAYTYSLHVDGVKADSKQLLIAH